mgnify:FL=1
MRQFTTNVVSLAVFFVFLALANTAEAHEPEFTAEIWLKSFSARTSGFELQLIAKEPTHYRFYILGPRIPQNPALPHIGINVEVLFPGAARKDMKLGPYLRRFATATAPEGSDWEGGWLQVFVPRPGKAQFRVSLFNDALRALRDINAEKFILIIEGWRIGVNSISSTQIDIPIKDILEPPPAPALPRRKNDKI